MDGNDLITKYKCIWNLFLIFFSLTWQKSFKILTLGWQSSYRISWSFCRKYDFAGPETRSWLWNSFANIVCSSEMAWKLRDLSVSFHFLLFVTFWNVPRFCRQLTEMVLQCFSVTHSGDFLFKIVHLSFVKYLLIGNIQASSILMDFFIICGNNDKSPKPEKSVYTDLSADEAAVIINSVGPRLHACLGRIRTANPLVAAPVDDRAWHDKKIASFCLWLHSNRGLIFKFGRTEDLWE